MRMLIDAGLSGKRIERLLASIDVCASSIDSILVTHEHTDHIKGLGILSRRYDIPIYANKATWISMEKSIGEIRERNIKIIESNKGFQLGGLDIYPFRIFHDAAEPLGYCIYYKDIKISIITDTGWVNDSIKGSIKGSSLYLMESNHDTKMLKEGRYPWYLKERILSDIGHLSNLDAGNALNDVLTGNGEIVLLAHLSKENNTPSIAYQTVSECMKRHGLNVYKDLELDLTYREKATQLYNL